MYGYKSLQRSLYAVSSLTSAQKLTCNTLKKKKKSPPPPCISEADSTCVILLDIDNLTENQPQMRLLSDHSKIRQSKATVSLYLSRDKAKITVLPTEHQTSISC